MTAHQEGWIQPTRREKSALQGFKLSAGTAMERERYREREREREEFKIQNIGAYTRTHLPAEFTNMRTVDTPTYTRHYALGTAKWHRELRCAAQKRL